MLARTIACSLVTAAIFAASAFAQGGAAPATPAGTPARGAVASAVEKEVKSLSAEDFPEREAAVKRLRALIADQINQRAQIQEILDALQNDLARQQRALAMVSDEEAQAQIAGLLEMERGLAGWTLQTMTEPVEKRKTLLAWGLGKDAAPLLARAYSENKRVRLDGVKQLAKLGDDGASWTLSRLINDKETAVRAAAMAVAWSRKPHPDIVDALWFRAVSGPMTFGESHSPMMEMATDSVLKVDFPEGEPLEFGTDEDGSLFFDSQLAGDVLVHLNSPLVAERMRALVVERVKAGKTLALNFDSDLTLVTHRLVETYMIKEAIPLLAQEALSTDSDEMGGDMNGRPFMWSRRTMAIGALARLINKDASDFGLFRARDMGDPRGWMWATDMNVNAMNNGNADRAVVTAFYTFWKDHAAEFGVKDVPPNPIRAVGRGRRGGAGGPAIDLPAVPPGGGIEPMPQPVRPEPRPMNPGAGGAPPAVDPALVDPPRRGGGPDEPVRNDLILLPRKK